MTFDPQWLDKYNLVAERVHLLIHHAASKKPQKLLKRVVSQFTRYL